jgi:plastocyanin
MSRLRLLAAALTVSVPLSALVSDSQAQRKPPGHSHKRHHKHRTHPVRPIPVTALQVRESEFHLSMSRTAAPAGEITVQQINTGQDQHDLVVERVDGASSQIRFPELRPGEMETRTISFTPGRYRLFCSLPGHDSSGMHAYLELK